jgi:hypothetical protein
MNTILRDMDTMSPHIRSVYTSICMILDGTLTFLLNMNTFLALA